MQNSPSCSGNNSNNHDDNHKDSLYLQRAECDIVLSLRGMVSLAHFTGEDMEAHEGLIGRVTQLEPRSANSTA
jgi:hypothetical protein